MEKKSIILVLLFLLMVYWVLGAMVADLNGSGGSVVCKFMEEYLQDNENKEISPEITDEGIRNSLLKKSDDLMRITESTYACHCDSAADYMKDGVSLKDMYADKCDNKCNILNRPLTKCSSDEECDFPMGCFTYDISLESFQSYEESGSSGSGVCIMDTSIHHLSDLISVYADAPAGSAPTGTDAGYTSHGSELQTYLESDEVNPFCYQPVTELVKVTDYNENGYVKSNTQDGNDCCLIKDFPDEDQTSLAMVGTFLDSEDGQAIIRQAEFAIVSNLAIMSARLVLAYSGTSTAGLMGRTLMSDGTVSLIHELKEGEQLVSKTGEAVDFLTMARSLEYGKVEVISRALRWVFFGGRQVESTALLGSHVGNFPGVFGILKSLKTAASGARGAQKLGQVALADMTEAGLGSAAAASRAAAEELGEIGGERAAETGGVAVAETIAERGGTVVGGRVAGGLGARAVLAPLKFLLTGPVGAALGALQLAGAVMDNYDMGGYQNILENKRTLKMFDAYTGPFIDGMKAITGREPPYGIDLVKTFFRGDDLVWPYHRCQEASTSDTWECSLENIKNKKDKAAAKALIIIVRALKQAELDEIHSKMKTQLNEMGKSLKDQGTYIDFLTGLDGGMNDNPADPTSGAANFLQEYLLDTLTLSYTGEEAQLRDKRYAQNITAAIRAPDTVGFGHTGGDKYLGWLEGDATDVIKDYSELKATSPEKATRLADNITPPPGLPSVESTPRGVTQDALVYFNSKLSPLYGGIQLTKRGVKLYNRYRNLRKDQEYIAFSKQYMAIADKRVEDGSSGYTYQLQKLNCHDIFEIGDDDYPGFAQMTQLNKLDPICRYGTKWGKEGEAVDVEHWGTDSMDLEHSWVKMKNGVTDPSDQPFGVSDTDPCPWGSGCYEASASVRNGTYPWSQPACKSTGPTTDGACESVTNPSDRACHAAAPGSCNFVAGHDEDNMTNSSNNYKNRIMAFNYNIYMRESVNARDTDILYNDQDPVLDYRHWASFEESSAHAGTWAIDDYKEWRSTAPVAFLLDPNDAIDDDNYTCNITANRVPSAASVNTVSYCGRLDGSRSTFNHGVATPPSQKGPLKWGGLGTVGQGQNGTWDIHDPQARYGQGPPGVGRERQYNECIISRTHEAFEFVFGTAITNNVERLFDWF